MKEESSLGDYICLKVQDVSAANQNVVIIMRDFSMLDYCVPGRTKVPTKVPEVLALRLEKTLHCVDLALYKVLSCQVISILYACVQCHIFDVFLSC